MSNTAATQPTITSPHAGGFFVPRYTRASHTMSNFRTHFIIPAKTREQLLAIADQKHLTYSALCRQVLMDYVASQSPQCSSSHS